MNNVQLVGNLTKDPELRQTSGGQSVCQFTVACQRRFRNANGTYDADFINCVAWRETADFVHRHFIKGNKIGLIGSIQTRTYEAQDGSKRYVTEVVVDNVEFVAPRSDSQQSDSGAYQRHAAAPPPRNEQMGMNMNGFAEVDDDELPF